MRGFLRTLTAQLLIAVIAAAAALPLVLCVSGPSHLALEFKVAGTGQRAATFAAATQRHSAPMAGTVAGQAEAHPGACEDRAAVPPAGFSMKRGPDPASCPRVEPPKAWVDPAPTGAVAFALQGRRAAPPFHHDPGRALRLRSVVLLI